MPGVTTAAAVWLSAAIGVMTAAGGHAAAAVSTVITLAIPVGLRLASPWPSGLAEIHAVHTSRPEQDIVANRSQQGLGLGP